MQIDTLAADDNEHDVLITTADELSGGIQASMTLISGCGTYFKIELRQNYINRPR